MEDKPREFAELVHRFGKVTGKRARAYGFCAATISAAVHRGLVRHEARSVGRNAYDVYLPPPVAPEDAPTRAPLRRYRRLSSLPAWGLYARGVLVASVRAEHAYQARDLFTGHGLKGEQVKRLP